MASTSDIMLVGLSFKWRDDYDLTDEEVGSIIDATGSVIDACIWICDMYVARFAANSSIIKVGPISLDESNSASDWEALKKNFVLRKNQGAGVPGGGGFAAGLGIAGANSGPVVADSFWVGQFDNPPATNP